MHWIDWAIIGVAVVALRVFSLSTRNYMNGVADFLSANRSAGRYLLTIASQMGGMGVVSIVATFEMINQAGFTPSWWGLMGVPIMPIILLTGWVYYRFRETRALTLAQFFEMRYSKRFRTFAGIVCYGTGILNFGIFPAVAARFFIYFCGLPLYYHIPGVPYVVHLTLFSQVFDLHTGSMLATIMALDLGFALAFVTMGGQISVMITECAQGIFCGFAFIIVSIAVMLQVKWPQIVTALSTAPAKASMIHPFHTSAMPDFNVSFFLIWLFSAFYGYMAWQGNSGFNSAARTPHEQKMGGIISVWRLMPLNLMTIILALGAFTVLRHPDFAAKAAQANVILKGIGNSTIASQMTVPVVLAALLPIGIKGLLATIMLFGSFTCHDTYMHSWGSIFIQDVWMPLRKKALSPEAHIRLLRKSIVFVAIFSFFFGLLYPQNAPILMFFAITGTIWLAGAGAAIIGGLYWKKGTTSAAYCAMIFGAILGVAGLTIPPIYESHFHHKFPVNNQWLYFIGMCSSAVIYVVVSLLTCKRDFNLQKMLHRGRYADTNAPVVQGDEPQSRWLQIVGITKGFSSSDKVLAIALIAWNAAWFIIFLVGTILNLTMKIGDGPWIKFWHSYILFYFVLSVPVTIWFAVGGIIDMKALYRTLATAVRDDSDDGRVVDEPESETEASLEEVSSGGIR